MRASLSLQRAAIYDCALRAESFVLAATRCCWWQMQVPLLLCGFAWFHCTLPHFTLAYEQTLTVAVSDVQEFAVLNPGQSHDQTSDREVRVVGVQ